MPSWDSWLAHITLCTDNSLVCFYLIQNSFFSQLPPNSTKEQYQTEILRQKDLERRLDHFRLNSHDPGPLEVSIFFFIFFVIYLNVAHLIFKDQLLDVINDMGRFVANEDEDDVYHFMLVHQERNRGKTCVNLHDSEITPESLVTILPFYYGGKTNVLQEILTYVFS